MSSIEGTGSYGDRIAELELVLTNVLECFEFGMEGVTVETSDGGIAVMPEDTEEALQAAMEVLNEGE
jgi:hypothetical protein